MTAPNRDQHRRDDHQHRRDDHYAGKWTRTLDVSATTVTNTGLMRYSHPDGSGMVALGPGKTVFDATTFNTLSDTAPTGADWQSGVCGYLAS